MLAHPELCAPADVCTGPQGPAATRCAPDDRRFRTLSEHSLQGILVHRDFKPLFANQALADMLGYESPDRILAQPCMIQHIHPDDRERLKRYSDARLRGDPAPTRYEFKGVRTDGSTVHVMTSVAMVDWDGAPAAMVTHIDITEHRRLENALRVAKDTAEQALAVKNRFLAAASHDLRQPVQALLLFLQAMGSRPHDAFTEKVLGQMRLSVESLSGLLNSLLDLTKLDAGVIRPEVQTLDVGSLLDCVRADCSGLAAAKNLDLRVVPSALLVRSDGVMLGRILRNFVTNAVRYTRQGRVLVGARRRGDQVRIAVWDTGVGIPEDQLSAIFADFHQAPGATAESGDGLGLGLAIADRMARLMGHPIGVASTLGKGSAFWVDVPRAG